MSVFSWDIMHVHSRSFLELNIPNFECVSSREECRLSLRRESAHQGLARPGSEVAVCIRKPEREDWGLIAGFRRILGCIKSNLMFLVNHFLIKFIIQL